MIDSPLQPTGRAARLLQVSRDWLKTEAEAGRLPSLRAGADFLFDVDLVERLLLERAREGGEVRHASK